MKTLVRRNFSLVALLFALLFSQALPAMAQSPAQTQTGANAISTAVSATAILLGTTIDQCSGQLYVANASGQWQRIQRGSWTTVSVNVNSSGYWWWKCGSTLERSRISILPTFVRTLRVYHSTQNRQITWKAYSG